MTLLTLWCGLKGQYTISKHDFLVLAFNNLFSLSALKDDYTGIPFPPKHIAPVCIQYTPTPPPLTPLHMEASDLDREEHMDF